MGSVLSSLSYANHVSLVKHNMRNGGCHQEFAVAVSNCHPAHPDMIKRPADPPKPVVDTEACASATAALRKCFGRNRQWFEYYINRLDHGLDEDVKPSPEQVEKENEWSWRWWTGMRIS